MQFSTDEDLRAAEIEGHRAFWRGEPMSSCPHPGIDFKDKTKPYPTMAQIEIRNAWASGWTSASLRSSPLDGTAPGSY